MPLSFTIASRLTAEVYAWNDGQVLPTRQGLVNIVWIDASCGYPLMDVARSTHLMTSGPLALSIIIERRHR